MTSGSIYIFTSPDDFETYNIELSDFLDFMASMECDKFVEVPGYNIFYNTDKIEYVKFYTGDEDATEEG